MALNRLLILIIPLLFLFCGIYAQIDPGIQKITGFPSRFFDKINYKAATLESRLDRQAEKYLQKVQLLWGFLSYQQVPQTQAIKFRIGYTL